jgi:D-glycero-alpha-D-manno-heptose 1-phosphate guanylyltransferase
LEVIILAGGKGTRLQSVVNDVPKPMALVNGKPFLEYILKWLVSFNISKIFLSVGYKHEIIIEYFGNKFNDIPIEYIIESIPLGTGGAILNCLEKTNDNDILIINGDTFYPINIEYFYEFHKNSNILISIALKRMYNFDRYGVVILDNNYIISSFKEKTFQLEGLINGGIYFVNRKILDFNRFPEAFSFEKEILEKKISLKQLKGKIFDEVFLDIGIPEDYFRASHIMNSYFLYNK